MRPRLLHSSWLISALAAVAEPVGSAPSTAGAVLPVRIVDSRCNLPDQWRSASGWHRCGAGDGARAPRRRPGCPGRAQRGRGVPAGRRVQHRVVGDRPDGNIKPELPGRAEHPEVDDSSATKTWVTERICPIRQPPGGLQHCPLVPSERGRESWAFC